MPGKVDAMRRCVEELTLILADLQAGASPTPGLLLGIHDWLAELRLIIEEDKT